MAAGKPAKDPLIVVLGATGTGKSQLAVELATRFNGEVINGDAMQMYQGLPIITNKTTAEEQQNVPHHLLGFIAIDEEPWRVGLFKKKAGEIIREIRSRGRLPIIVGGTHYYTQSLIFDDSLVNGGTDQGNRVQSELSNKEISERYPILDGPTEAIMERLRVVDPVMAARWHPGDRRKIRRSLEIFLMTGRKASDIYAEQKENKSLAKNTNTVEDIESQSVADLESTLLFWVHCDSTVLKERLDSRVDKMVDAGLLKEVVTMEEYLQSQKSIGDTIDQTRGIWASIGWKEFKLYLDAVKSGSTSQEELEKLYSLSIEQTQAATRQYAKRQIRWIRLKLVHALADEDALDRLYLIDGSDVTRWIDNVLNPAINIVTDFLEGAKKLPLPRELSAAARELLNPTEAIDKPDQDSWQECKLCHVTTVTEVQWQTHLKSRRHRALIKKRQKNEARDRSYHPEK